MNNQSEVKETPNCPLENDNEDFPFDPYAGGRHLNAISENPNLNSMQKLLMLTIGSQLDFRDIANSERFITQAKLSKLMSCSRETVNRLVKTLVESKYLLATQRFKDNKQKANLYALSSKVFIEYANLWCDAGSHRGVTQDHTEIPNKNSLMKKKDNTKVLSKKVPERSNETDQGGICEAPPPTKKPSTTAKKKWEVRQCQEYGLQMFKPNFVPGQHKHDPGTAAIYSTMIRMHTKYGYRVIKAFFEDISERGLCGELPWNQKVLDTALMDTKTAIEVQNNDSLDEEARKAIDDIPW